MTTTELAAPTADAAGRARRTRWRLIICLAVVVAAIGWVATRGLTGSFVYYLTPTDIISKHQADVGQRVRLGGYVVKGSLARPAQELTFTVTDGTKSMHVVNTGSVPELFRGGQGVVLEGTLGADGLFHSDTLLVKHSGTYEPPKAGQKPVEKARLADSGSSR